MRLVTGRGKHSPGEPVIKHEVDRLLYKDMQRRVARGENVFPYQEARGGGAFDILLRF